MTSSKQAAYRSLLPYGKSSFTTLLLLSPQNLAIFRGPLGDGRARTPSGGGAGVAIPSGDEPVPGINTCGLYALTGGCKLHEGGAAARPGIVYIYQRERRADDCCLN